MTGRRLVDAPAPRMGARRRAVLDLLREADRASEPGAPDAPGAPDEPGAPGGVPGRAMSVEDVARRTGLHPNTARFHLDGLVEDGLAERSTERRSTPGRRRVLYAARSERAGERSYGLLAEMVTGMVASLDGARDAAVETGRAWGRSLARDRAEGDPVERLRQVFDEVGFAPEVRRAVDRSGPGSPGGPEGHPGPSAGPAVDADVTEIHLHHCPFIEVARKHTDVVCSIHLGLMTGVLDEAGGDVEAESLRPFVAPGLCVARVRAQAEGDTRPIRTRQTSGPSSR